ncbi:hypothetical protein [Methanohalobium sp.]|uniref:hypothetical protein n=1 Tax=Methanohalobium sp. TaxID=2837493 RepID=UPI0025E6D4F0|nr:hypothetical protein [Methanohalobium sp.]
MAFIQSSINQRWLMPPDIRETIRTNHIVYLIGPFVEGIHININCRTAYLVIGC